MPNTIQQKAESYHIQWYEKLKNCLVGSRALLLCHTQQNRFITCPVFPIDSSCRKNSCQLIGHIAATDCLAPGHVWDQSLQLQHTPVGSTEETSRDPLSCVGTWPLCRHFAASISTCKVERMEEYRFLQERKKNNGLMEASDFQALSVNTMDFLCYPVHT